MLQKSGTNSKGTGKCLGRPFAIRYTPAFAGLVKTDGIEFGDAAPQVNPFLLGPGGRKPLPLEQDASGLHFDRDLHAWVVPSPLAQSDTRAVRRSGVLLAREIHFQEYLAYSGVSALPRALGARAILALMNLAYRFSWSRLLLASW